jgi:hypothetical protein
VVGLVAHHLKPGMFRKAVLVGDGAFRDRAGGPQSLARLARPTVWAAGYCSAPAAFLVPRSARASAVSTARRRPSWAPPAGPRPFARATDRRNSAPGLREAARRRRVQRRGSDLRGTRDHRRLVIRRTRGSAQRARSARRTGRWRVRNRVESSIESS